MKKLLAILFLLVSISSSSQCVITIDSSGAEQRLIITNNGINAHDGEFKAGHSLWNVDFDSVTVADQQAILTVAPGCLVPVTSSVSTGRKIRTLITAAQNALEARAKLSGALFTGAFGYDNGMGALVTQLTSKSTAVTINNLVGKITTHNASLAAGAEVTFTVNNSLVTATDYVDVGISSGGTIGAYHVFRSSTSNGGFTITISNLTLGILSQAIQIDFIVIKGNG